MHLQTGCEIFPIFSNIQMHSLPKCIFINLFTKEILAQVVNGSVCVCVRQSHSLVIPDLSCDSGAFLRTLLIS